MAAPGEPAGVVDGGQSGSSSEGDDDEEVPSLFPEASIEGLAVACEAHADGVTALAELGKFTPGQLQVVLGESDPEGLAALHSVVQRAMGEAARVRDLVELEVASFCVAHNVAGRRATQGVMPLTDHWGVVDNAVQSAVREHDAWGREYEAWYAARQSVLRRALCLWRMHAATQEAP